MGMPQSRSDHFGKEKYVQVFTLEEIKPRFIGRSSQSPINILAPMTKEMKHCLFARLETVVLQYYTQRQMTDRNTFCEIKAIAGLFCAF
jgi:hypothetical protein